MRRMLLAKVKTVAASAALACVLGLSGPGTSKALGAEAGPGKKAEIRFGHIRVLDGVVQPRRPLGEMVRKAMLLLQEDRRDKEYVPGKMGEKLPGYIRNAYLGGGRGRLFPADHHALFIDTFLRYHAYTGKREWLDRARDIADWNIAHSTDPKWVYGDLPFSSWHWKIDMMDQNQRKERFKWGDWGSIETDKPCFVGSMYLAVYRATEDEKYLQGAKKIADTLLKHQRDDGSWPFRVIPENGNVHADYGCAAVLAVQFFEDLMQGAGDDPRYRKARDGALQWMFKHPIQKNAWSGYHQDVGGGRLNSPHKVFMPMAYTARYLLRHRGEHEEFLEAALRLHSRVKETFVFSEADGYPLGPAPGTAEQGAARDRIGCGVMPCHTALYCILLADLYGATGRDEYRKTAVSGINSLTWMQADSGAISTWIWHPQRDKKENPVRNREEFESWWDKVMKGRGGNWYSIHIYTVGLILEAMGCFTELAPDGEDHLLKSTGPVREIGYAKGRVEFETARPSTSVLKLSFEPRSVRARGKRLAKKSKLLGKAYGWSIDRKRGVLTIRHPEGKVVVSR